MLSHCASQSELKTIVGETSSKCHKLKKTADKLGATPRKRKWFDTILETLNEQTGSNVGFSLLTNVDGIY